MRQAVKDDLLNSWDELIRTKKLKEMVDKARFQNELDCNAIAEEDSDE